MIYRTSHRSTYRNLNQNLGSLSYRIAQLTNQIASERRINTPSDDPSGAAKVLGTRSTLSSIAQYRTNIAVSDLWLSESGQAVQTIKETLDKVYSEAEQGATDTVSPEQRKIIAKQIDELFQSIIQYGDATIGDSYIFGGQKVGTQPFSRQVEAQKVIAGCQNSTKWTGKVVNYGDATFNNRPDLPIHSQDFLIEVVQPGGIDSRYYSNNSKLGTGILNGSGYGFRFNSLDAKYNNVKVSFQSVVDDKPETGTVTQNNGISYTSTHQPMTIKYVNGPANSALSSATASWNAGDNTLTVTLNRTDSGSARATADDVITAVNAAGAPVTAADTGASTGAGLVQTGSITFNNAPSVKVDGNNVTVFIPQNSSGSSMAMSAGAVAALLNGDPTVSGMFTTTVTGAASIVNATSSPVEFQLGVPYTLAQANMNPKGTQNDLIWSVKNGSSHIGSKGNELSVEYKVVYPFTTSPTPPLIYNSATGEITVNVAVSASIYNQAFTQAYNDGGSSAYKDSNKAHEIALAAAVTTTANDVRAMVAADPQLSRVVEVNLADGSSGDGRINSVPRTQFGEGYDQPAMFRVSQDGGKTWGPPMSFSASEYKTNDMFYNSTLGHASLTTGLSGKANDLVFTAKHMGTWGNDLRVQYNLPQTKPSPLSIEVGPESWNICVNLEVDAAGNVLTTANDIMEAINKHPLASQLVTADLANYHEGGNGIVKPMDCKSLTVGEPYQVDGKSIITPLGHATGSVSFPYSATAQKCPNITFQAIEQGPDGNDLGVRYTTSADPTHYASSADAEGQYQDFTSVRYEKTADGKTVMVVHLATETLPSCPDPEKDREASEKWKELYPTYSCTSGRAVTTTAGDVMQAVMDMNTKDPASAVIWPSMERWPEGWDTSAKVGPTDGTVWLTGGNDTDDASKHGVNLSFIPDGTALQTGDVFEVPVGWYRGDDKNIDINSGSDYRTTMNVTGNTILGDNGKDGNILDTVQRLVWALENNDSAMIGKELPKLRAAIEKVTTVETTIGTKQVRNEFISKNLEQAKYSSEKYLSETEDADFSQLITDLKNAQTVYEACLGATGLTSKVSLLNYI